MEGEREKPGSQLQQASGTLSPENGYLEVGIPFNMWGKYGANPAIKLAYFLALQCVHTETKKQTCGETNYGSQLHHILIAKGLQQQTIETKHAKESYKK